MPAAATMLEVDASMELEDCRIDYLPTSLEITQACAEIRARWSANEQRRRFVGELISEEIPQDWRPPVIDTSGFRLAMNSVRENV